MKELIMPCDGKQVPVAACYLDENRVWEFRTCSETCKNNGNTCVGCPIQKCFDKLEKFESMQKELEDKIATIEESLDYPHNFKGQMVKDFEWVLSLISRE